MKNVFNRPYDLLKSKVFRYTYVYGGAGFAFIFLWVFEPYRLYYLEPQEKFISLVLFIGSAFPFMIGQFFFLQERIFVKYTIGNTIIWIALSFMIIGLCVFCVYTLLYNDGVFSFVHFVFFQGVILAINIIPTSIIILIHHNYLISKTLKSNSSTIEYKTPTSKESPRYDIVTLESQNNNDKFELPLSSLLLITKAENYVTILYMDGKSIERRLIRNSLRNIALYCKNFPELFRCHKSFIVNKVLIEEITGNANGYKIKLKNYSEYIPISRKLNNTIHEILNL